MFGFVVVADRTEQVAGQPLVLPKGEDTVLVFLRIGPVIALALAAVSGLGEDVFREAPTVGEKLQTVSGRGIGILLDAPPDPLFGKQPGDEGIVAFTVLHAVAARPGVGKEAGNFFAPLPGGNVSVVGENGFDDVGASLR